MKDALIIGGVSADMDEIDDIQYIMNISYIGHRMRTLTRPHGTKQLVDKLHPQSTKKVTGEYVGSDKARPLFSVRGFT